MLSKNRVVARWGLLPVTLLALGACQVGPSPETQQKLRDLETVSARKDSLLLAVAEHARMMSEIGAELAVVQVRGKQLEVSTESPLAAARDTMIQKIRYLTARVDESDRRLRDSRRRIQELTSLSDSLRATLEATIDNYERVLETQRETIASLTEQLNNLEVENVRLAAQVDTLEAENTTVYYVIGTKHELLERGIVEKEGGARFLFIFGKRGETLVPARNLEPGAFTAINKREVTEIALPDADNEYRIASRQALEYLATPPDEKGRIAGSLEITAPDEFWSASKFLIIVQG